MSTRLRSALAIWRSRNPRPPGDLAFTIYAGLTVTAIIVFPLARAIWLFASSPAVISFLAHPSAAAWFGFIAVAVWASALLLGSKRGPALRSSFITQVLASSDIPRARSFRGPLLRAGAVTTVVITATTVLLGAALFAGNSIEALPAIGFAAAGVAAGIIASICWLLGQVYQRAAAPVAAIVLALGVATLALPSLQPFSPAGWLALSYPTAASWQAITALSGLAVIALAAVPAIMTHLELNVLVAQARRWESTLAFGTNMDFEGAASLFRTPPTKGRRLQAVSRSRGALLMFIWRDFMGAIRAPGRFASGVVTISAAGLLLTLAFLPSAPAWVFGAGSGLLLFGGLGPLTDGLRHAATAVTDLPLYGVSDERLLSYHSALPLLLLMTVLLVAVLACCAAVGTDVLGPASAALIAGFLVFATRIASFLKGTMPPALMSPMPTPAGDLSVAVRAVRALDGLLLAVLCGGVAVTAFIAPWSLALTVAAVLSLGVYRWRQRRR